MSKTIIAVVVAVAALPVFAGIEMGAPFTDGAVLQRGMKVPVWGKVTPAQSKVLRKVRVEFAGQEKTAVVGKDGVWRVDLDPMEASKESRTMTVSRLSPGFFFDGVEETVEIKDILVGEVWFASGQSNMECPIWGNSTRYRDMKGGLMTTMTYLPNIRYVKCERKWSAEPKELSAKWCKFTPEDLQLFHRVETRLGGSNTGVSLSAVAFYYARELYLALDVPIGILDASWGGHQQPTVLYNGMVASFAPMAMRGFIWYQGCHNSGESQLYCAKLHALYNGWSRDFANPDLKLYLVQLAPYNQNWLGICMAQNKFCAEEKNAALAVTADVGNFDDIHPNDKEIVAKRLAVHALKRDYGFAIPEDDSPVLKSASFADSKATLAFDNVKDWYVYAPNRSRNPAFELAGADGKWYDAKVINYRQHKGGDGKEVDTDYIDTPEIVLSSEAVPEPVKVRYMGKPRMSGTLYNEASLPLGPFETK